MKKYTYPAIFIIAGGIGGYFYWKYFGCTESCPITSNPYMMMAYGGLVGAVLAPFGKKKKSKETEK